MATGMRRALLLLAAFLAAPAAADPQRHPAPQPVVREALAPAVVPTPAPPLKPALWKLADPDTTIWLFGTIHVMPKGQQWFVGPLAAAADGSGELVTELGEIDQNELLAAVLDLGFLPPGQTLRGLMAPADRAAFEAALARLGEPVEKYERIKPWYAANLILLAQLRAAGIEAINGPEGFLTDRFKASARPSKGLETVRYQLGLFDALPQEVQLAYLREVVAGGAKVVAEVDKITGEWGQGQAESLAVTMNEASDDPIMYERLLVERNKIWGQWLKARLDQPGTVFVAVGAGHLAGKGSVQDQLAALGLTATRVQ
ncbi:MAG: TraB/GumN family protein [Novosphingobium sp.]